MFTAFFGKGHTYKGAAGLFFTFLLGLASGKIYLLVFQTYLDAIDHDLSRLVGPRGSFTFRAITVIPMKLPDELFDYEVLLAEGK